VAANTRSTSAPTEPSNGRHTDGTIKRQAPMCQHVRTQAIDAEIERAVLDALVPDRLAIALATMEEVECEEAALSKQWQLRLERSRYAAERARRQYDTGEPENRLVARNLEIHWEDKLRTVATEPTNR